MMIGNPRMSSECNPLWGRVKDPPKRASAAATLSPPVKQIVRRQHPLYQTSSHAIGTEDFGDQARRLGRDCGFSEEFRGGKPNDPSVELIMFRERALIVNPNRSRKHTKLDEFSGHQRPLSYSFAPKSNEITPSLHFQNGTVRYGNEAVQNHY